MQKLLETNNPKKSHFHSFLNKYKYKVRVDYLLKSGVKFIIKNHEGIINS